MSVSAEAPPGSAPHTPGRGAAGSPQPEMPSRSLAVAGGIAACAVAAGGLAVLTTLTAIGWITAPHMGLGSGLPGVLRAAGVLWLVAHHVGITVHGVGPVGMLPLGLVLVPCALLVRAGRWMVQAGQVTRLRHVGYAALAIAFPYALLTGAVAVASRTPVASPSLLQAVIAGFMLALCGSGLGAARGLAPWPKLAGLVPARPRSVIMGVIAALAVLTAAGAVLAGGSLAAHLATYRAATDALSPGPGGAVLLLLAGLGYLPNAIIWAVAYALGPGFAFGSGTVVAPTGAALGAVPAFPMLAALPAGPRAGVPAWMAFAVLAAPYLAGVLAGLVTVRVTPTPMLEAAPLWGFVTGSAAGIVSGVAAAASGGPLGAGRLVSVGPSGVQVGLVAILEVGVSAAVTAGLANWLLLRRHAGQDVGPADADGYTEPRRVEAHVPLVTHQPGTPAVIDETDDAGGHRIYLDPWADGEDS